LQRFYVILFIKVFKYQNFLGVNMKKIINISSLSVVASAIALSLIFTGCGDTDPENKGNHLPDVNIVQNNKTINVGTKVDLTSTALDVDGDALTYEWKFVSKPTGSSATLTTTTTKQASFTADKAGEYVVQFVAKDVVDAVGKDTVTITAKEAGTISNTCTSYTEIAGKTYSTDTTLDGCYKVTNTLYVSSNALLTIKAGSVLLFEDGAELKIESTGALSAKGTAIAPILFSATQKTAGYWDGIYFSSSNNIKNELDNIVIEYAGKSNNGALTLYSDSRIKVSNSVFKYSGNHGFSFDSASVVDKFENITSTKNKLTAGYLYPSNLGAIDSNSKFTGNTKNDVITLKGGSVSKDTTWHKLTVPVYINGTVYVNNETTLTINAGAVFKGGDGAELHIEDDGSLTAKGTEKEPILFSAMQETAGYWDGIYFSSSNNNKNELDYVVIKYAGKSNRGALTLYSNSRIKISNSTFSDSKQHGFSFDNASSIDKFENITSTKNTLTAGYLYPSAMGIITSDSDFTGNIQKDVLTLKGGSVTKNATWDKLTVPVYINGTVYVNNEATLTINAGAIFKGGDGAQLHIEDDGSLTAKGTGNEPILFSAMQETVGYWDGIYFSSSNNVKNKLEHIIVEYAGSHNNGALTLYSTSRVNVSNSTFRNNDKYGISVDSNSNINSDYITSNTFTNNGSGTTH